MIFLRSVQSTAATHPLGLALLAFLLGGLLTSTHIFGAVLGLLIHALNLAWIVVAAAVMIVTVWLLCLSFERNPHGR